ncbi:MAG TPA: dihydrolipoamide acetyltransferase family protein [Geminicoccaceae bacterium]|jgi:pyruvate dehydrogenase E2 component (dihydrolipoamide acetyltransferase)|nr:dihydrolipoamide acetyltransferase family protein [Geminicoccaceae bacterium]
MKTFDLPDLGEGLQEAEIVNWHVGPGDQVVADQPLVSVETDKAVVEVPSPRAGRIAELFGAAGDIVKVGAPLVAFDDGASADTGTVVGEIRASEERAEEATTAGRAGPAGSIKATPAVRALARRKGVDLALVSPSGPAGVITAADVERAATDLLEAGPLEPLRGVRRAMATRMAHAHAEVVPATVSDDADVEAWRGSDVTIRLVRAIVAGCAAEPALNVWFDSQNQGRRLHDKIDLGIAVDTGDGLFVPVLRDVANRDPADLRRGLDRMKADILARTIPPEELRGATITLSNFGSLSGRYAAPVVVPPQVAILSTGRAVPRIVAIDGRPAVHRIMPLSLTFDHRVVTGGEAARFLMAVIADLERAD